MRIDYHIGSLYPVSQWVCIEHSGYAHKKAEEWWHARCSSLMPETALEAVELAERGLLASPLQVTIESTEGEKYPQILDVKLGGRPDVQSILDREELPF